MTSHVVKVPFVRMRMTARISGRFFVQAWSGMRRKNGSRPRPRTSQLMQVTIGTRGRNTRGDKTLRVFGSVVDLLWVT